LNVVSGVAVPIPTKPFPRALRSVDPLGAMKILPVPAAPSLKA